MMGTAAVLMASDMGAVVAAVLGVALYAVRGCR